MDIFFFKDNIFNRLLIFLFCYFFLLLKTAILLITSPTFLISNLDFDVPSMVFLICILSEDVWYYKFGWIAIFF